MRRINIYTEMYDFYLPEQTECLIILCLFVTEVTSQKCRRAPNVEAMAIMLKMIALGRGQDEINMHQDRCFEMVWKSSPNNYRLPEINVPWLISTPNDHFGL